MLIVCKLPSAEFTTYGIIVLRNGEYSFISNIQIHYFVKMCLGYELIDLNNTVLYTSEFLQALTDKNEVYN